MGAGVGVEVGTRIMFARGVWSTDSRDASRIVSGSGVAYSRELGDPSSESSKRMSSCIVWASSSAGTPTRMSRLDSLEANVCQGKGMHDIDIVYTILFFGLNSGSLRVPNQSEYIVLYHDPT